MAAASCPSHGRTGSACTIWQRRQESMFALNGKGEEPPSNMHDVRAAAAPLALKLKWTTLFSCRFFAGKHKNPLELESLISLLRRSTRHNGSWYLWIRAWSLGAISKGRSSSRKIHFLRRKLGFWCLAYDTALELVWVLIWVNPAIAPGESWYASLPKIPSTPTTVLASAPALSELYLLREPLSVADHTAGEHVRESSNPMEPSVV